MLSSRQYVAVVRLRLRLPRQNTSHTGHQKRTLSTVVDEVDPKVSSGGNVLQQAIQAQKPRHDWTKAEIREVYHTPLMELVHQAVCCPSAGWGSEVGELMGNI